MEGQIAERVRVLREGDDASKMAAAKAFAVQRARSASPKKRSLKGGPSSPQRREADKFQQDVNGFLRSRRKKKAAGDDA